MRNEKKPQICACAIMRDEAAHVPAWLAAVRPFAARIVVADTGSEDETRALLQAGGAEVLKVPWQDDFAAARNAVLAVADAPEAAVDWIVFLDADETIEQPEALHAALASLPASVQAAALCLRNVTADGQEMDRVPVLRALRAHQSIRYRGRIHEQLYVGDALPVSERLSGMTICHTGYDAAVVMAKHRRNLPLLREEERRGGSPLLPRYLAQCLFGLGDYAEAERYARRALREEPPTLDGKQTLYLLVLDALQAQRKPLAEQIAFAAEARQAHPEYLDLVARHGLLLWRAGEKDEAATLLRAFCARLERGDVPAQFAPTARSLLLPVRLALHAYEDAQAWDALTPEAQHAAALRLGGQDVRLLFAALFLGTGTRGLEELPDAMRHVIEYARGTRASLAPEDEEGYRAGLAAIEGFAPTPRRADYAVLSLQFSWACVRDTAQAFLRMEEWEIAWTLLQEVPAAEIGDAAAFWHMAGIACYHLAGQEAVAAECFARAEAAGSAARDIPAYREWLAERLARQEGESHHEEE
ncbi:glycosyltransferase [Selenomonas bovis]|uniref:glycosyltransferase n=1 Tax=Selenomonas bovis TaxID=416586 RepID=UPI003CFE73E2